MSNPLSNNSRKQVQLNKINFNDLLILDCDIDKYNFNVYLNNGEHHLIKGFCTRCEKKGINVCPTDSSFRLQNISHGATSKDVLLACGQQNIDLTDWKSEGVMFLMEGPSKGYDFYEENKCNRYKKKPTKEWYWIHKTRGKYSYPQEFKGGQYGGLFNSIIFTFKLKNAYLTNLVKCGLNNKEGKYKGIEEYNPECKSTCYENILLKEIDIIKPKVVFCFGSKVFDYLWEQYPNNPFPWTVVSLPHPAGRRRGFKNEFYRHLYFTMILEGLYKSHIYTIIDAENKFKDFLTLNK